MTICQQGVAVEIKDMTVRQWYKSQVVGKLMTLKTLSRASVEHIVNTASMIADLLIDEDNNNGP